MKEYVKKLALLLKAGETVAQATILSHKGSTPRAAGSKMAVTQNGTIVGTVGGGKVEAEVIKEAAEVIQSDRCRVRRFDLTGAPGEGGLDIICGGRLEILIEPLAADRATIEVFQQLNDLMEKGETPLLLTDLGDADKEITTTRHAVVNPDHTVYGQFPHPPGWLERLLEQCGNRRFASVLTIGNRRFLAEPVSLPDTVYIFGAGHVARELAELTHGVGFRTVVIDDRVDFANINRFPQADRVVVPQSFARALEDIATDRDSYLVIVTRAHSHDKEVLAQALKTDAGYIGMIGSRRKRDTIYKALLQERFNQADLERVHCPIGLEIGADTPREIAVSIIAQLIDFRARKAG